MEVDFIPQPNLQLGLEISDMLVATPPAELVVFVSAFISLQTTMRLRNQILELNQSGVSVRFVLGIDLGGTSREVLEELLQWGIDVRIVKHRNARHTFHPKMYLFEWNTHATLIVGSNNITEGGFFGNYETAARITYRFPGDEQEYAMARSQLDYVIEPSSPVSYRLTQDFLSELIDRHEIPTEAEARQTHLLARRPRTTGTAAQTHQIFGLEDIAPPPPLPADLLARLVRNVRARRSTRQATGGLGTPLPLDEDGSGDALLPAAFYMTLPTLQGPNIPGEARIPLEAIELAQEFWGWPDHYSREESPRAGMNRVYWNWRPLWRIWSVDRPNDVISQEVRMYMYENSSDFRFYARPIVNAGGDIGDVVRIRRISEPDGPEFECVLARRGTTQHTSWVSYCTQPVRNSTRSFGYA